MTLNILFLERMSLFISETQYFDIKFPRRRVPSKKTTYTCMVVEVPEVGDHHMVANKPLVDNDHVMHHMLLYGCEGNLQKFHILTFKYLENLVHRKFKWYSIL